MNEQAFFEFLSELTINLNKKYKPEHWEKLNHYIQKTFPKDTLPYFSHLMDSITQLKKNEDFAIFSNRTTELIHQINLELSKLAPLNKILHLSIERLRHISRADIISIQLLDKDTNTFHIEAATGFPNNMVPIGSWDVSENLNQLLSTDRKIVVCPNLKKDDPIDSEFINMVYKPLDIVSYLASPLIVNNNFIGFVIMARYREYASTDFKLKMLERFSAQTAISVQNNQIYSEEKRLLQFHIDLMNLLLEDGYQKIIYQFHEFLNIDVLLIDKYGQIITHAIKKHSDASCDLFKIDFSNYLKESNSRDSHIYFNVNGVSFQAVPIKLHDLSYYYLVFLEHLDCKKTFNLLAIEQIKTIIALKYAHELANFEIEKKLRQDYIYELLFNLDSTEELIRRGRFFKFPFNQENYIVTILFDHDMPENIANQNAIKIRNSLPINVSKYSVVHSSTLILIVSKSNLDETIKILLNVIPKQHKNIFSIGVSSSVVSAEEYPKGFEESKKCAIFGREIFKKKVVYYEELGIIGLLFDSNNYQNILKFKSKYIGPLIELDKKYQTDYIKTLDCYLQNESIIQKTAEKLHVHYNTVRYRLSKIEELLDIDLNNHFNRLNLQLALTIEHALATNS